LRLYILSANKKLKWIGVLFFLVKRKQMSERENDLNEFASAIEIELKTCRSYAFRTVSIDGVLCYPVIHKHRKIVNFECVYVNCNVKNEWGDFVKERYSVYHKKYKNIHQAILIIEKVIATYKLLNGDLVSPEDYKTSLLEKKFNPYLESQVCCVCYENTMELTECEHYLCLKCRDTCIRKEKPDCPMCRKKDAATIYNIDNGLINNIVYEHVKQVNEFERKPPAPTRSPIINFRINAVIDRIGDRRSRSPSAENYHSLPHGTILFDEMFSMDADQNEELSEVSTISNIEDDDSDELPVINLYELFNNVVPEDMV